ncbi:cuticle collagen 40-like isoform X1 [Heliangelus exortis]|uniref:cuticle collagen 40-like isoform X1 n=1 Tax=Heliangelus exortis TaxID=472823 RepID=UPI003A8E0DE5
MRRGLLCALALSLLAMAPAHPGDPRKGPPGGGRRWPHSPCSGCFSVLSEEWGSRSQDGEEEEEQGGRVRTETAVAPPDRCPHEEHQDTAPHQDAAGGPGPPGPCCGTPPCSPSPEAAVGGPGTPLPPPHPQNASGCPPPPPPAANKGSEEKGEGVEGLGGSGGF